MNHERYSVECNDEVVRIHGYLSIGEAFSFLSFYENLGYDFVSVGDQNSSLLLTKTDRSKTKNTTYETNLEKKVEEAKKLTLTSIENRECPFCGQGFKKNE
jgi:hypothetical protein